MKILVAAEDSKFAETAVKAVIAQVKPHGAEIELLHVLEPFPAALAEKMGNKDYPDFCGARLKLRDEAKEILAKAAEQFRAAGFKVNTELVKEGDPREVILDCAEHWPADLIVVGSRGRKGLKGFMMGSVSEAVARHARCSVQIVRIRPDH